MQQTTNVESAIASPTPATHYVLEKEVHFANRIQVANAIAEQIWREQQLVSNRMQWNFTFQVFLSGIYVFAGSNLDGWAKVFIQIELSLVGLFVTLFCLIGVKAAQNQSMRLKIHWVNEFHPSPPPEPGKCNIVQGPYP